MPIAYNRQHCNVTVFRVSLKSKKWIRCLYDSWQKYTASFIEYLDMKLNLLETMGSRRKKRPNGYRKKCHLLSLTIIHLRDSGLDLNHVMQKWLLWVKTLLTKLVSQNTLNAHKCNWGTYHVVSQKRTQNYSTYITRIVVQLTVPWEHVNFH